MINLHRMLHFAKWTLAVDKPYYRMSMTIYLAATAICLQLLNIDYLLDKNGNPRINKAGNIICAPNFPF